MSNLSPRAPTAQARAARRWYVYLIFCRSGAIYTGIARNVAPRYAQHLAGTDVAMESAGVVLMRSDPMDVGLALELSRTTLRKIRQNLVCAVLYNVIAFPLAAGVIYPRLLNPEIAALSMSGSTVLVAFNALLLKRTPLSDRVAS